MSFLSGDELLTPELLRRFSERIQKSLEGEPIDMTAPRHRRALADLLARVGELNHYQLLEISVSSSEQEVYDAYLRLARVVHPSHVERLSLAGLSAGPEILFERATLAYLTLSDDERRREYHVDAGLAPANSGPTPVGDERIEEEKALAARNYKLANQMASDEEYFYAIELLYTAIRLAPEAPYYALLASCQAHNPRWRRKAIHNYARAVELNPADDVSRLASAHLYEDDGNLPMARREYSALLERMPGHPDALEALKRLKG